ncbi:MAG: hypothetical protein ABJH68_19595 [Ilumatobacter sp.]|uniref:DUF5691 domain-containing protein n=1 Tax=Ilumatobacter sp. TaxID=1967498 RepID=UPI0032988130
MTIDELWRGLVTTALLGTDRRDPPSAQGELGDLVADSVRADPSSRMLAQVAACTAVRRAGVLPGPPLMPLAPPVADDRPPCPRAAVDRWRHITTSWPVLEDEWMLTLIEQGWRLAPELVPQVLRRQRRDPVRRIRVLVAAGPLAAWLGEHLPELDSASTRRPTGVEMERMAVLPDLPVPPDLVALLTAGGAEIGGTIAIGLEERTLGEAHRAVLINVIARCRTDALVDVADVLDSVDPSSPGRGLASVLADLATTRHRMLDELTAR